MSEYNPFNFVGPDGQLTGMDRDIIRAAAKRLGIKHVEFKPMRRSLAWSVLAGRENRPDRQQLLADARARASLRLHHAVLRARRTGLIVDRGYRPVRHGSQHGREAYRRPKGSYPEAWAREHVPTATILPVEGTSAELDDMLRTGQVDHRGLLHAAEGCRAEHKDGGGFKNALLQPMRAAFAVRKNSKELREALDGVLKKMWADGSLNKIKRVYLDPLEIEPAKSP